MLAAGTNHAGNRVRETASEGTRTVLTSFCLYAKHLARIRKIPCAYTQNFLAYTQNKTEKSHLIFQFFFHFLFRFRKVLYICNRVTLKEERKAKKQ